MTEGGSDASGGISHSAESISRQSPDTGHRTLILIPGYNPDDALVGVVEGVAAQAPGEATFVIVDDGSDKPESAQVFKAIESRSDVVLLRHPVNLGKGAALKSGLRYAKENGASHLVTADADGQHLPADIIAVAKAAHDSELMHIGVRQFDKRTPLRSRLGNAITQWLFDRVSKNGVSDTQSGLRVIPARYYDMLIGINADRYDFEFEALCLIADKDPIIAVPITTVYEPGNPSSHFNPLVDSARIYFVLARYFAAVPAITVLDVLGFLAASAVMNPVTAFWVTRSVTILIYIYAMGSLVFRGEDKVRQGFQLFLLCLVNIVVATQLISWVLSVSDAPPILGYALTTILMVGVNFLVQHFIIFRRTRHDPK